jgi:serine/threonine protein kinase
VEENIAPLHPVVRRGHDVGAAITVINEAEPLVARVQIREEDDGPAVRISLGRHIGQYELIRRCQPDGVGTTWLARMRHRDRVVVLRTIAAEEWESSEQADRWLLEATRATQLRHPGIATVREVSRNNQYTLIVSNRACGASVASKIEDSDVEPRYAVALTAAVADILGYAHQHSVIHGDLTPERIVLKTSPRRRRHFVHALPNGSPGRSRSNSEWLRFLGERPVLTGFGAVRHTNDCTSSNRGYTFKRLAYASPERVLGRTDLSDRTDVYSTGVLLYELLTSELPFRGVPDTMIPRILHESPTPLRHLNNAIPEALEYIVSRCLAKDPESRYRAQELADELRNWLDHGNRVTSSASGRLWRRVKGMVTGSAIAGTCLIAGSFLPSIGTRPAVDSVAVQPQITPAIVPESPLTPTTDSAESVPTREESYFSDAIAQETEFATAAEWSDLDPACDQLVESQPAAAEPEPVAETDSLFHAARQTQLTGSPAEALVAYDRARQTLESALESDPSSVRLHLDLVTTHRESARLQKTLGLAAQSEQSLLLASGMLESWPDPSSREQQRLLGEIYGQLARQQAESGTLEKALESHQKSLLVRRRLSELDSSDPEVRVDLADSYCNVALLQGRLRRSSESRDNLARAQRIWEGMRPKPTDSARQMRERAQFLNNVGCTQFAIGDHRGAFASFAQARGLFERIAEVEGADRTTLSQIAQSVANAAAAKSASGERLAAKRLLDRASELRAQLNEKSTGDAEPLTAVTTTP